MLIIFNFIGAGILIAGIGAGALVTYVFGDKTGAASILVEGLVVVALDLLYRSKAEGRSLLHPRRGGHICFIPAWIIGLGLLGFSAYGFVSWNPEPPARRESVQAIQADGGPPQVQPGSASQAVPAQAARSFIGLKVNMISGSGPHGLAMINGENFAVGETHSLKVGQTNIVVTCVDIGDHAVVAKVEGDSRPLQLKLGETRPLAAAP
jgi:hypothetical protein